MKRDDISKYGFEEGWFINRYNYIWMPVETTLIGNSNSNFFKSWMAAVEKYKSYGLPDLIQFSEIQITYPPANMSRAINPDGNEVTARANTLYQKDLSNVANAGKLLIKELFVRTLEKYPNNNIVKNNYAKWLMDNGSADEAAKLWQEIISKHPDHVAALINLANINFISNNYANAREYYSKALNLDAAKKDNILRNICILEFKDGDIVKAKEYFRLMNDNTVLRNNNPAIYLELIQ
ncbi:MAG: tetratricopeptide repeat protein [Candidatus Cloacimonetes bacterium]|nr:tetratricopeptide repeat protein [Candidatus Cloacimonadota bacterium]